MVVLESIGRKGVFFYARACAYIENISERRAASKQAEKAVPSSLLTACCLLFIAMSASSASLTFSQASADLKSSDLKRKYAAIQAMKNFKQADSLPALTKALSVERDIHVLAAILDSLTTLGNPQAIPAIAPLLSNSNAFVRQRAAYAISLIGGPQAEAALAGTLTDKDPHVRATAVQGLGLCGTGRQVPVLERALSDTNPMVRSHALHSLRRIPGKDALNAVKNARHHADPKIKKQAARELKERLQGAP